MATEHVDETSPKLLQFEQFSHQIDSQASGVVESNFLPPLEDSQETQDVASGSHNNYGSQETDVIKKPSQLTIGPFFSLPERENLLDFQNGFQYSKAPTPWGFSTNPSALSKEISHQINSMNDSVVQVAHQFRGSGRSPVDGPFPDSRDKPMARTQIGELPPSTRENKNDAVSIHSDAYSDATMLRDDQPEKQDPSATQDDPTHRPPFQITSPFSKIPASFRQPKGNIRSPAAKLEGPKLSKAFSDIQRKALIQSTHTQYHSRSQVDRVSPSMFPKQKSGPGTIEVPKASNTRTRQLQQLRPGLAFDQPPTTPEAQTFVAVSRPRSNRSSTVKMTRPYIQEEGGDYIMRTRTESRASNISKARVHQFIKEKHSQKGHVSQPPQESNTHRLKLAGGLNSYFAHEDSRKKAWERKIVNMANQLAERDKRVAEYLAEMQTRDQIIDDLRTANKEQDTVCQEQEASLARLGKQQQSLQGKIKEYKVRLNDSTKEQQNIFKYFQPRYSAMREQIKQAEDSHRSSLEEALSNAEKIRGRIQKSVEEVRTLSQEEMQKLRIEIATLQEKLAERGKEVDREKNLVNDLRQGLKESHEIKKDALKILNTQNQELVKKSDEGAIRVQSIENCLNQQGLKVHSLLELMENNIKNTVSHSELAQSLKDLKTDVLDSVLSEFRKHTASDRELSSKAKMDLKAEISAIHEVCTGLGKKIQDKQTASEWQEKYGKIQLNHQALRGETDRLKEELFKVKGEARTQLGQYQDLQQELATLRVSAEIASEAEKQIKKLENVKQKIQGSLDEKEKCIKGLEDKLRGAEEVLNIQASQLEDHRRQILAEQEKHAQAISSCLEQQEQAVEQAKTEESARAQMQYQIVQKRLQNTEQNCSQLQQELIRVKQEAENALISKNDESTKQMQETIEPIVNRMDEVLDGLLVLEQQKGDLAANLEAWSNDHIELSLVQQVVQKLAKEQQAAIGNGKQLWELLDVQKKLEGTWQSHNSEVDAIKRATELEKSVNAERERESRRERKGKRPTKMSQVANRRVMIQFPGHNDIDDGTVVPRSIEEERVTRRQAVSPTGIMKPALLQVEGRPEGSYHKTPVTPKEAKGRLGRQVANRGAAPSLVSHSAYNRPVLGAKEIAISENKGPVFVDMSSTVKKRKITELETEERNNAEESELRPIKRGTYDQADTTARKTRTRTAGTASPASTIEKRIDRTKVTFSCDLWVYGLSTQ
ncbi:hypothetical protein F4803DRAFT_574384 [Xylaria telfairii]|nr:hypothetical protein F4803DRAFT_574384 [Xylaria telfairii]